jgi:N-acetylmuramoyl-L-alanine amidase
VLRAAGKPHPVHFIDRPSPNFEPRTTEIDLVVLHYTGMYNAAIALRRLTDPAPLAGQYPGPWQDPDIDPMTQLGRVSAHYLIDEEARVYRLVHEAHRAWHAGASSWEGRTDTNDRSIGIEIANGGHDFDLPDFTEKQINAVIVLLQEILPRHGLWPSRVVGHADVAPGRKRDPGEKFPWGRLAEFGVALAPRCAVGQGGEVLLKRGDEGEAVRALQEKLACIGYGLAATGVFDEPTFHCVHALQTRYRQRELSGAVDQETRDIVDEIAGQIVAARPATT